MDLSPQTPLWRLNPWRLTLPPVNLTLVAGGPAPPSPPDAKRHIPTKESLQRGTEVRLDDLTPLWKLKDFPQGASFCFQFSFATDLPSPNPNPCHLLSPLDRQNRGSLATTARTPSLTLRKPVSAPYRPTGGLVFSRSHENSRRRRFHATSRPRDRFAPTGKPTGGAPGILREGPILMGRDKQKRPVQRRKGDPARVLAPQGGLGGQVPPVPSLEPWYDPLHGEEPGSRKEEMHGHLQGEGSPGETAIRRQQVLAARIRSASNVRPQLPERTGASNTNRVEHPGRHLEAAQGGTRRWETHHLDGAQLLQPFPRGVLQTPHALLAELRGIVQEPQRHAGEDSPEGVPTQGPAPLTSPRGRSRSNRPR